MQTSKCLSACLLTVRPHKCVPHFKHIQSERSYSKSPASASPFVVFAHSTHFSFSTDDFLNMRRNFCMSTARLVCVHFGPASDGLFVLKLSSDDESLSLLTHGSACLRLFTIVIYMNTLKLLRKMCKKRLETSYEKLCRHQKNFLHSKQFNLTFDNMFDSPV